MREGLPVERTVSLGGSSNDKKKQTSRFGEHTSQKIDIIEKDTLSNGKKKKKICCPLTVAECSLLTFTQDMDAPRREKASLQKPGTRPLQRKNKPMTTACQREVQGPSHQENKKPQWGVTKGEN